MASFRKRSRPELPSEDALLEEAQQSDKSFSDFKSGFEAVSSSRVTEFGRRKLQNLGEREKVCWLFATYPATTVAALGTALSSIKGEITDLQRSKILGQYLGLTPTEASSPGDFIESECSVWHAVHHKIMVTSSTSFGRNIATKRAQYNDQKRSQYNDQKFCF